MRDALLEAGHDVTVIAPAHQQSDIGTALTLAPYTGPDSLFEGITGLDKPDLVVSNINAGANIRLLAVTSGTVSAAVAALFNYEVPAIAVSAGSFTVPDGLHATSAEFVTKLIADLQQTQGDHGLLPVELGLNVNFPDNANPVDFAFTVPHKASYISIGVGPSATNPGEMGFSFDGSVGSDDLRSEGGNFNAGKITITPLDSNFASSDDALNGVLGKLLNTEYGRPTSGLSDLVDAQQVAVDQINGLNQDLLQGSGATGFAVGLEQSVARYDNAIGVYTVDEEGSFGAVRILDLKEGSTNLDVPGQGHRLGFVMVSDGGTLIGQLVGACHLDNAAAFMPASTTSTLSLSTMPRTRCWATCPSPSTPISPTAATP